MVAGLCGVTSEILGSAAPEPQQTDSKNGADLAEVGRQVLLCRLRGSLAAHDTPTAQAVASKALVRTGAA